MTSADVLQKSNKQNLLQIQVKILNLLNNLLLRELNMSLKMFFTQNHVTNVKPDFRILFYTAMVSKLGQAEPMQEVY